MLSATALSWHGLLLAETARASPEDMRGGVTGGVLSIGQIGVLAAAYPAVWAMAQVATGALSDRLGRKPLIVAGMLLQAVAIAAIALGSSFNVW